MPKLNLRSTRRRTSLGHALRAALNRHEMTQYQFSSLAGLDPSKSSRLIRGHFGCDAATVTAILDVFPERSDKFSIVEAFIRDMTSPEIRAQIDISPRAAVSPHLADCSALSPEAESALRYILDLAEQGHDVECLFVDFAKAIGWRRGALKNAQSVEPVKRSRGKALSGASRILHAAAESVAKTPRLSEEQPPAE